MVKGLDKRTTSLEWDAIARSIKPAILPDPKTVLSQMQNIFQLPENIKNNLIPLRDF